MEGAGKIIISVQSLIEASVKKVWDCWTKPEHIIHWNHASDDWHSPKAENDLRNEGRFNVRMEAKDGSMGFDFEGVYDEVKLYELIKYKMADGRVVTIQFSEMDNKTEVIESFDAETGNSIDYKKAAGRPFLIILKNIQKGPN